METTSKWNSLTAMDKGLFFVISKDNDKFYWTCFKVDNTLTKKGQLNVTTPLFDTLEEVRAAVQIYFENIYSRFYVEQYQSPSFINKIFTIKDISGIPHAIAANEIENALKKEDITLFDLEISGIAKLRQERNEAVERLQRIKETLEDIT